MALYRKYRPATFAEVVGQEHVTDPLSIALDTGRISHAYLFSGPRGCGKTSSARILARSLNCVEGPTSTPCGVCSSCVALGPGGSGNLDVIELDAASHGGVDDTRELRDRAFYAPAESRYRVFIVDEAHMVTTAGFNALLKIVEEPPAHLIFVFATTEPEKVLPTIRSRTHHYPFRLLPPATMRGLLGKICDQEHVEVEESVYPLVIRAGGGSPRDSLSVLDQLLAGAGPEGVTYPRAVSLLGVTDVALIDDAVDALANSDGAALFGTIDRVVEAGHDPRRFATDLLERLRDLILLRAVPDATERNLVTGPGDVIARMQDQAARLGPATLARHAELLHEGLGDMRGATAPRLLLEVVAARMLLPAASDAETATLQRLETLERRMSGGAIPPAQSAAPVAATGQAVSTPPAAAPAPAVDASGAPRRRGAEALAALRGTRGGPTTPTTPQQQQAPTSPQQAAPAAPQQPVVPPVPEASTTAAPHADSSAHAPVAAVRPPEMSAARVPLSDAAPDAAAAGVEAAVPQPISVVDTASTAPVEFAQVESDAPAAAPVTAVSSVETSAQPVEVAASQGDSGISAGSVGGASPAAVLDDVEIDPDQMALGADIDASDAESADDPVPAFAFSGESGGAATVSEVAARFAAEAEATGAVAATGDTAAVTGAAVGGEPVWAVASAVVDSEPAVAPEPVATPEPAAESAAVAVPGAADSDDVLREIEAAWADIRAKVREFGAAVQALLSGASVSRLEGGTIVFAHQHAPLAQRLSQPQNLDAVRSAVKAVLGREHDVKWEVGGGGAPAAPQGSAGAAGKGPAGAGAAPKKVAAKFSRPSQAKGAASVAATTVAAPVAWGSPAPSGGSSDGAAGDSAANVSAPSAGIASASGSGTAVAEPAPAAESYVRPSAAAVRNAPPEDDIPLPDGPDYPDDPGPSDYSPVGYDGVPPATTAEEERELLAAAAVPIPAEERRDPDDVALELLRSELGATPLEG
ncbi:DNA polymerase III subunit gamma and tau [Nocardia sp. SYP-A9097]|uniref:DNA polymerase III subunit gamma and tau n=1 Tax=Nocardia sp. SYP-A9097 TaxID=2663237 RepID=UPI002815DC96|nr:DNA polymerase III subunit gamma and tau [Nocardia sp. SYP-A9097]